MPGSPTLRGKFFPIHRRGRSCGLSFYRSAMELWTTGLPETGAATAQAARAEANGWDGITFVDSQNLIGDPFVATALVVLCAATVASIVPATRAMRVDPVRTLRR